MTLGDWLEHARALGLTRLDVQLLAAHHLGQPRSWVIAHPEVVLAPAQQAALDDAARQRAAGCPLAYLVGEREFHGLALRVTPAVLVPRPETELLVDWGLELLREQPGAAVADLGTGSGAIALAVKHGAPAAQLTATDSSATALAVARASAERLALAVEWLQGDWWAPLAGRRFDLVLANPPYIAEGDPHLADLTHEPAGALSPGGDGLGALRAIVAGAAAHLQPCGWLLLEHGYDQAAAVQQLLRDAGFTAVQTRHDLGGQPRATGGRAPV